MTSVEARFICAAAILASLAPSAIAQSVHGATDADRLISALSAVAHAPSVAEWQADPTPRETASAASTAASTTGSEPRSNAAGAADAPQDAASVLGGTSAHNGAPAPGDVPAFEVEKFGAQNSLRVAFEGDWICDWSGDNQAQGRIGLQWFFFDNVELDMFGTVNYVSQTGPNAFGGGFDLQLRWHFLALESWSIFGEIGGGILATTENVPTSGSSFNFTPNIGFGATFALDDSTRLYAGVRWFHISNAALYANNPGRENTSIWVGLSFKL